MNNVNQEENPTQDRTSKKNAFVDVYHHNQEIADNPEKYNPSTPTKDVATTFVVFVLSVLFPVLGLILYGIWKDDEIWLARSSLIGFWINFLFAAYTIVSLFFFY